LKILPGELADSNRGKYLRNPDAIVAGVAPMSVLLFRFVEVWTS
jgi:hypothetical protein